MLKNRKNNRQLALLVAFALSAGGTLFSDLKHISAADVTGGDVTIDSSTPTPYPNPLAGGYIPTLGTGDVYNNKLTIDGTYLSGTSVKVYAGYNQSSTGDATYNELIFKNGGIANYYF